MDAERTTAVDIAERIEQAIREIRQGLQKIDGIARHKAETSAEYEKNLAITVLQLKNGAITEWQGQPIKNLPATSIDRVARGICNEDKLNADTAEAAYKSLIVKIDALQSILNGYQSIFRHLEKA